MVCSTLDMNTGMVEMWNMTSKIHAAMVLCIESILIKNQKVKW